MRFTWLVLLSFSLPAALSGFCSAMINRLFLALVLMFQVLPSFAADAPDYPASLASISFNGDQRKTDPAVACACVVSGSCVNPASGNKGIFTLTGPAHYAASYECKIAYSNGTFSGVLNRSPAWACPSGGTAPASTVTIAMCTNVPEGQGPNPCGDKNPIIRRYNYGLTGPYTSPDNFAGCKVTVQQMLSCGKTSTGSYCFWQVVRTGEQYTGPDNTSTGGGSNDPTSTPPVNSTPTPSPPLTPPPGPPGMCSTCRPCPAGTVQAGIGPDGVPMCVGTGTTPPAPPSTPTTTTNPPIKTTAADGTTTTTQVTSQPNKDGSTTTTTTTTTVKPDGTTTVTRDAVVSNNSAGTPGATDKPGDDDKFNLCKQNPTLSICRESSVSGTCGAITCVGDAIQCSTLRAAALMQCQQQQDIDDLKASPQKALGSSILAGADPMKAEIDAALKGTEVDLSKPNLDTAGFLGGGSCFPNKSFSVMGKAVTVDFTAACSSIQPLRAGVLACAFIVAYLIVARSVLAA